MRILFVIRGVVSPECIALTSCLTIGVQLLIVQLRWCQSMSKRFSTVDVRVQSEELLTWQRRISQNPIHAVGTRSIFERDADYSLFIYFFAYCLFCPDLTLAL